jgi:hypothetical protein
VYLIAGTFVLSNLGMFGVDRFDAILPPGVVSNASYGVDFFFSDGLALSSHLIHFRGIVLWVVLLLYTELGNQVS